MGRLAVAGALTALLGVAVLTMPTTSAYACSPPTGPISIGNVVVEGRVTSYRIAVSPSFEGAEERNLPALAREDVELQIENVLFGEAENSRIALSREAWVGRVQGGSCGVLAENLQDAYVVVGLWRQDDGTYRWPERRPLFVGEQPLGEEYEAALQRARDLLVLPTTGTGLAPSRAVNHLVAGIAAFGVALLAASIAIRGRPTTDN